MGARMFQVGGKNPSKKLLLQQLEAPVRLDATDPHEKQVGPSLLGQSHILLSPKPLDPDSGCYLLSLSSLMGH